MKKALKWIRNSLFYGIVIILLLTVISQLLPVETAMKTIGFTPFMIVTDSMTGELNTLDILVVRRAKMEQLKEGDIISFYAPLYPDQEKEIISHYVASVEPKGSEWEIHTKSNVSIQWDDWVLSPEDIIGVKWFSIPKLGYLFWGFQNPIILRNIIVLLILIKVLIMVLNEPTVPKEDVLSEEKGSL